MNINDLIKCKNGIYKNMRQVKKSKYLKDYLNAPKNYKFLETDENIKMFLDVFLTKFTIRAGPYVLYNPRYHMELSCFRVIKFRMCTKA